MNSVHLTEVTLEFPLKISAYQAPLNLLSPLAQHSCQTPNVDAQETLKGYMATAVLVYEVTHSVITF